MLKPRRVQLSPLNLVLWMTLCVGCGKGDTSSPGTGKGPGPARNTRDLDKRMKKGDTSALRQLITPDNTAVIAALAEAGTRDPYELMATIGARIDYPKYPDGRGYDEVVHGQGDYWQTPEETLTRKTGDCEDQAFLLASLLRAAGVPESDVLVGVGMVAFPGQKPGGHAWVLLRWKGEFAILEATESKRVGAKVSWARTGKQKWVCAGAALAVGGVLLGMGPLAVVGVCFILYGALSEVDVKEIHDLSIRGSTYTSSFVMNDRHFGKGDNIPSSVAANLGLPGVGDRASLGFTYPVRALVDTWDVNGSSIGRLSTVKGGTEVNARIGIRNSSDSQVELPLTLKAFLHRGDKKTLVKTAEMPLSIPPGGQVDKNLTFLATEPTEASKGEHYCLEVECGFFTFGEDAIPLRLYVRSQAVLDFESSMAANNLEHASSLIGVIAQKDGPAEVPLLKARLECRYRRYPVAFSLLEEYLRSDSANIDSILAGVDFQLLRDTPEFREWLRCQVNWLFGAKRDATAAAFINYLRTGSPRDPELLILQAWIEAKQGHDEAAVSHLGRAIRFGYKDIVEIVTDSTFPKLNERSDFKEAVAPLSTSREYVDWYSGYALTLPSEDWRFSVRSSPEGDVLFHRSPSGAFSPSGMVKTMLAGDIGLRERLDQIAEEIERETHGKVRITDYVAFEAGERRKGARAVLQVVRGGIQYSEAVLLWGAGSVKSVMSVQGLTAEAPQNLVAEVERLLCSFRPISVETRVRLVSGHIAVGDNAGGDVPDSFVVVSRNGQPAFKSSRSDDSWYPVWNQDFGIITETGDTILMQVWDEDTLDNQHLFSWEWRKAFDWDFLPTTANKSYVIARKLSRRVARSHPLLGEWVDARFRQVTRNVITSQTEDGYRLAALEYEKVLAWLSEYGEGQLQPERLQTIKSLSHYNIACWHSRWRKDSEGAVRHLEESFKAGWKDWALLQKDTDLDPLRKDPRFKAIVEQYRK